MKCHNETDYITLDPWSEVTEQDIIYIDFENFVYCYNRQTLIQFLSQSDSVMADWTPRNIENGMDSSGYGGMPGIYRFFKLPDGTHWITERSFRLLVYTNIRYFKSTLLVSALPIGNVQGVFGVGMLHGNNPQNIYDLYFDEDKQKLTTDQLILNQLIQFNDTFDYNSLKHLVKHLAELNNMYDLSMYDDIPMPIYKELISIIISKWRDELSILLFLNNYEKDVTDIFVKKYRCILHCIQYVLTILKLDNINYTPELTEIADDIILDYTDFYTNHECISVIKDLNEPNIHYQLELLLTKKKNYERYMFKYIPELINSDSYFNFVPYYSDDIVF